VRFESIPKEKLADEKGGDRRDNHFRSNKLLVIVLSVTGLSVTGLSTELLQPWLSLTDSRRSPYLRPDTARDGYILKSLVEFS
jgi:hypothetical protein